jgi:uncharacterized protein (DUF433 family)
MTAALSGATLSQLKYWRRADRPLLVPEYSARRPVLYSYFDLLAARVVSYLREQRSLQKIRAAVENLRGLGMTEHLAKYDLVPQGRQGVAVVERNGHTGLELVEKPGQHTFIVSLRAVIGPFETEWTRVPPLEHPRRRLDVNPAVRGGYPVVSGTRLDYDLIAGLVQDGVPPDEIKKYYPSVSAAAARDAASFAESVNQVD